MNSRLTFFVGTPASGKIEVLRELNLMRSTRAPLNGLVTVSGVISSPENSLVPYNVNAMFNVLHSKLVARSSIVALSSRTIQRPAKIIFVFSLMGDIEEQTDYLKKQREQIEKKYQELHLATPIFFLVITNYDAESGKLRRRGFSITSKVGLDEGQKNIIQQLIMVFRVKANAVISFDNFSDMKKFVKGIKDAIKRPAFECLQVSFIAHVEHKISPEENSSSQTYLMEESSRSTSPSSPLKINTRLEVDDASMLNPKFDRELRPILEAKNSNCPEEPFLEAIEVMLFQPAKNENEEQMKGRVLNAIELLQKKMRSIDKWDNDKYQALSEELSLFLTSLAQPIVNDPKHWDARAEQLIEFRKSVRSITKTCSSAGKACVSVAGLALGGLAGTALIGPGMPALVVAGKMIGCALFGAKAAGGASSFDDDGTSKLLFNVAEAALEFAKCNDSFDMQFIPVALPVNSVLKKRN